MRIIVLLNHLHAAGRTTAVWNLGWKMAELGHRGGTHRAQSDFFLYLRWIPDSLPYGKFSHSRNPENT